MPEWFADNAGELGSLSPLMVAMRLVAASLFGAFVATLYYLHRSPRSIQATFPLTLVLLSVLIAMVMQVIDDRVARAFSLVGALSIVRFRTVLDDTEDIAFVIFSVVVGMAVGTGAFLVAVIGSAVMMVTLFVARLVRRRKVHSGSVLEPPSQSMMVKARSAIGGRYEEAIVEAMKEFSTSIRVLEVETVRGGAFFDWSFAISLKEECSVAGLMDSLVKIEGIQSVDIKVRDSNG